MLHLFANEVEIKSTLLSKAAGRDVYFKITRLTSGDKDKYMAMIMGGVEHGKKGKSSVQQIGSIGKAQRFAVSKGLIGWRGMKDANGQDMACDTANKQELFNMPTDIYSELANAITNFTNTGDPNSDEDGDDLGVELADDPNGESFLSDSTDAS